MLPFLEAITALLVVEAKENKNNDQSPPAEPLDLLFSWTGNLVALFCPRFATRRGSLLPVTPVSPGEHQHEMCNNLAKGRQELYDQHGSSRYTAERVCRSKRLNSSKGLVSDHRSIPCRPQSSMHRIKDQNCRSLQPDMLQNIKSEV